MKPTLKDLVKVELTQNQTQALEMFISHLGTDVFKNSTLLKVLNKNDLDSVPRELSRWVIDSGRRSEEMTQQRQIEIDLFTKNS